MYKRARQVCLCGHAQVYMHDMLGCTGPHSVHGCILNWISIFAPPPPTQCARDRDEKTICALKTHLNMENELKEMLKRGALAIGAQGKIKWGESVYIVIFFK